jgi:hypothetical protein
MPWPFTTRIHNIYQQVRLIPALQHHHNRHPRILAKPSLIGQHQPPKILVALLTTRTWIGGQIMSLIGVRHGKARTRIHYIFLLWSNQDPIKRIFLVLLNNGGPSWQSCGLFIAICSSFLACILLRASSLAFHVFSLS